jgi:hypothetical protein
MTTAEFRNLREGDICIVKSGYDKGRYVEVRYIEGELIVIKAIDGKPLHKLHEHETPLRLTSWRVLDIDKGQ